MKDWLLRASVATGTLVVFCWGIATPAPWKDETFTMGAATAGWSDLFALLQGQDAVHGTYYALMHVWLLVDPSIGWARALSAVAAAAAAVAVLEAGTRLRSPTAGLLGAAVFVALPAVNRYAQDARPGALIMAVATWSIVALLAGRWRWYAVLVTVTGLLSVLALLALPAHALAARDRRRFAAAAAVGVSAAAPVLLLSVLQRQQLAWLPEPGWAHVHSYVVWIFGAPYVWPVLLAGGAVGSVVARRWWPVVLVVLPPAATFVLSWTFMPLFAHRYMMFTVPVIAVFVGVALSTIHRALATTLVVGVAVLLSPGQVIIRGPLGHERETPAIAAVRQVPSDGDPRGVQVRDVR